MANSIRVLVTDDDETICYLLKEQLIERDFEVQLAYNGRQAIDSLKKGGFDILILDLHMQILSGEEVLKFVRDSMPQLPVIVLTGETEISKAIECIKLGAYDYKTKPYNFEDLVLTIHRALDHHKLVIRNEILTKKTNADAPIKIIGGSPGLQHVITLAQKAARSESNILIEGETGTGKELLAEFIHRNSPRADKPFVVINCASLPDQLIESELFGYEKGAFTDAKTSKPGLVEIANGGTLFLDEIGEMSLTVQPKLLRFLENGEFRRIGGITSLSSQVRIISATNRNLLEESEKKLFRRDLLFRLNVITLTIPPLRERREDIALLAEHFLKLKSPVRSQKHLSPEAAAVLAEYDFPGNIRELEHIIERSIIFSDHDRIEPADLSLPLPQRKQGRASHVQVPEPVPAGGVPPLEEIEKEHILHALRANSWERVSTALQLGISQKTLYTKIKKYGLLPDE